jgi:hypothetical protein
VPIHTANSISNFHDYNTERTNYTIKSLNKDKIKIESSISNYEGYILQKPWEGLWEL